MPDSASHQSPTLSRFPKIDTDPFVIPRAPSRAATELAERYEHLYVTASGDPSCLPWCHPGPNRGVIQWLNTRASGLVRPGARTVVVGCGLGDDVIELANRGYDACGFDVSPTCIDWARRRFPAYAERFLLGDVLDPPTRLRARFDLVVEAFTIQSVWPSVRDEAFGGVVSLAKPHGIVLMLGRSRGDDVPLEECECAPYPVCRSELLERMAALGFSPVHGPDECLDDDDPPRACLRAAFRRG
ncbi:MAG: methyltransferase domain-containing protein [Phycisphaerales bacterium]|nr:methyltransferase domain-containing protein [Phycisphaerales bacterium]